MRIYGVDAPESKQLCLDSGGREYKCGAPHRLRSPTCIRNRYYSLGIEGLLSSYLSVVLRTLTYMSLSRWPGPRYALEQVQCNL